jgi:hypothetical protein
MAAIENWLVSSKSDFFQFPENLREVHARFRKDPIQLIDPVRDTFHREGLPRFGLSNVLQRADILDRKDLKFKFVEGVKIHGKKGMYWGQGLKVGLLRKFTPHGLGRFISSDGETMYEGQFEDGQPHGVGRLYNWSQVTEKIFHKSQPFEFEPLTEIEKKLQAFFLIIDDKTK